MRTMKKLTFGLIFLGSTAIAAPLSNTLFTITPSETTLPLSSNGSGNVMYTVTNNATVNVTPSITVSYESAGNNLTIASNSCTTSLSPQASCTFRVLISGSNQPQHFTITPRVCGFNASICSISSSTVHVTVTRPAAGLPTRAYEQVVDNNASTTTLLGININNPSDVISFNLEMTNGINSVVVSPDGSKVYAVQHESGGGSSIAFFDVASDHLTLTRIVPLAFSFRHNAPALSNEMAITPDGSTLFITQYSGFSHFKKRPVPAPAFYRLDLTTDANIAFPIDDPDNILRESRGVVVSPDSKTVYVGTDSDYIVAMPTNALSVHPSNKVAEGSLPNDDHPGLAIDSAGNKLYVGNYTEGSVTILAVNGEQAVFEETILANEGYFGASGLAISPDGSTLYVAETDNNSVLAVPVNNAGAYLVSSGISGAFGLGLSLDGSTLYVSQGEDGINKTTVINTADFLASPTAIAIMGASLTIGQFIGP